MSSASSQDPYESHEPIPWFWLALGFALGAAFTVCLTLVVVLAAESGRSSTSRPAPPVRPTSTRLSRLAPGALPYHAYQERHGTPPVQDAELSYVAANFLPSAAKDAALQVGYEGVTGRMTAQYDGSPLNAAADTKLESSAYRSDKWIDP